jgi:hypothetical protein
VAHIEPHRGIERELLLKEEPPKGIRKGKCPIHPPIVEILSFFPMIRDRVHYTIHHGKDGGFPVGLSFVPPKITGGHDPRRVVCPPLGHRNEFTVDFYDSFLHLTSYERETHQRKAARIASILDFALPSRYWFL